MSKKAVLFSVLLVLSIFASNGKTTVAVLDIEGPDLKQSEIVALTDRLVVELMKVDEFLVLERNAMGAILQEQGLQQTGCTLGECAVEIGQLLGVQKMISCKIGSVGRYHSISLRVVSVESGAVEQSVVLDIKGTIETVLLTGIEKAVQKLGYSDNKKNVTLKVRKNEKGKRSTYKKSKSLTILFASGAFITTGVAGYNWYQKSEYHDDYLAATIQGDINTYSDKEKRATIIAGAFTGASVVLIPMTIIQARKTKRLKPTSVTLLPVVSPTSIGLTLSGRF